MAAMEKGMNTARTRQTKVRTGCVTCKIRKVKCDELKPACKRCTDTGRKCDGYLNLEEVKKARQQQTLAKRHQKSPNLVNGPQSFLADALSGEDLYWVGYFSRGAGPALSGFADKDFWSCILPQLSFSDSAIRHALIAVSSSHAIFEAEAGRGPNALMIKRDFGLKHYNQAIVSLQRQLGAASQNTETPLICCLLFICLECLYGNRLLVLEHLRNGLNILDTSRLQHDQSGLVSFLKQKLNQIFGRLDAQSTLFGKPVSEKVHELVSVPSLANFSSFADLNEAQQGLDILIALSLKFIKSLRDGSFAEISGGVSRHELQQRLQEQLFAWRGGLNELERNLQEQSHFSEQTASMLHIQNSACFIYLSTCLELGESSYDIFIPEFTTMIERAETLARQGTFSFMTDTNTTPTNRLFSLDASVIPPLFLTAIKCRDPVLRRRAVDLLETNAGREGLWDARLHARVARRVIYVEERSMPRLSGAHIAALDEASMIRSEGIEPQDWFALAPSELPDECFRVHRADIFRTSLEEPCRSARVIFFTAPDGLLEPLACWEEEIGF